MKTMRSIIKEKGGFKKAASAIGIRRQWLYAIASGATCSPYVASEIERYTWGLVRAIDLIKKDKHKPRRATK